MTLRQILWVKTFNYIITVYQIKSNNVFVVWFIVVVIALFPLRFIWPIYNCNQEQHTMNIENVRTLPGVQLSSHTYHILCSFFWSARVILLQMFATSTHNHVFCVFWLKPTSSTCSVHLNLLGIIVCSQHSQRLFLGTFKTLAQISPLCKRASPYLNKTSTCLHVRYHNLLKH